MNRKAFQGLLLRQDEYKYFEIYVSSSNQNDIVLTHWPNRNPAEKMLAELATKITSIWEEVTV
jgi:hypothetical protein